MYYRLYNNELNLFMAFYFYTGKKGEGVRHEGGEHLVHLVLLSLELMIDNPEVWERQGDQSEADLIFASAK